MKYTSVQFAAILAVVLCITPLRAALACSCVIEEPFDWWVDNSTWVFKGTAVATKREWLNLDSDIHQTRLQVESVLKGDMTKEVIIHHGISGPSCGLRFEEGQTYIILAGKGRGRYYTSSCDQNAVWTFEPEFEEAFRESGYAPLLQAPAGKRALAFFERTILAPFLLSPWLIAVPLIFIVLLRHMKRRGATGPKGDMRIDIMASSLIILVCVMAGAADSYGRYWNSVYSLRIDEGYHIQSFNDHEVCLKKTTGAQRNSGRELVCAFWDTPEFGPVTGYFVRDDIILVRTAGAVEVTNEIGYTSWDIDASVTFFFVVDKSTDAVTGPLTTKEFATVLSPSTVAEVDWKVPGPPMTWRVLIQLSMILFATAFSVLYLGIEIAATHLIATLVLGLALFVWVAWRKSEA